MKIALLFREGSGNDLLQRELWKRALICLGYEMVSSADPAASDLAVVWGAPPKNKGILKAFQQVGKPVLVVDYPYWNRPTKEFNPESAYKVSLNGLHPTPYLRRETMPGERYIATMGPKILPWRKEGKYILFAGMGIKGEELYGYRTCEWDQKAVMLVKKHTHLPLIYRKKPSNKTRRVVTGAAQDNGKTPISELMKHAWAVVTHHGNAAVEAIASGVPGFVNDGVAGMMGNYDLTRIMHPVYADDREQFFWNLAWWQWTAQEISQGAPLLSLRARGLI